MSDLDKLGALGAYSVGGRLVWKNKVLGTLSDGRLTLTDEGKEVLSMDVTDVEIKSETPRRPRVKRTAEAVSQVDEVVIDI